MCGCLSHAPYWGPGRQPRHVPRLEIEPATLWFIRAALNPLSHTSQGRVSTLFACFSLRDHHYKTTSNGNEFYSTMPLYNKYYIPLFSKSGVICSKFGGKIQPIIFGALFSSSVGFCNNLGFSNVKTRRLSYPLFSMVPILPLLC